MDGDRSNVVWVGFEGLDLLTGVVVSDPEFEVIAANADPVLSADESACADWDIGKFVTFDDRLYFIGPYVCMAVIECGEDPWLGIVKVDALNAL
jgi:hypothetical protein